MSKAYYNEFDKKAAAWLRELIKRGLIVNGDVDERSINDVRATDLTGYRQCHFFAGVGGWSLALRLAGWPDDRPVWTGSCPCQPFSVAGKGLGTADERHLWPVFRELIRECRPPSAFGEQVASRAGREWLTGVRADLEAMGYGVGAADLCAAGVGAPHIRQRLYWMADAGHEQARRCAAPEQAQRRRAFGDASGCGNGCRMADATRRGQRIDGSASRATGHDDQRGEDGGMGDAASRGLAQGDATQQAGFDGQATPWSRYVTIPCGDGKARRIEPGLAALAHGVPARVVRLRGYGNAIVPQVAAAFIRTSVEALA